MHRMTLQNDSNLAGTRTVGASTVLEECYLGRRLVEAEAGFGALVSLTTGV